MTNEELLREAVEGVWGAKVVLATAWEKGCLSAVDAQALVLLLRRASAAAQELERRAAGMPAPVVG